MLLLLITYYVLPITYRLLPTAYRRPLTTHCLQFATHYLPPISHIVISASRHNAIVLDACLIVYGSWLEAHGQEKRGAGAPNQRLGSHALFS